MFTPLDTLLFPNDCEVYEYQAGKYLYNIFKNGSSSIRRLGFNRLSNDEISKLKSVDVFIRDPLDRYASGVQMYLDSLDESCDKSTAIKFIEEYIFVNRHHSLQLHWLLNLGRYISKDTLIHIKDISEAYNITKNLNQKNICVRDGRLVPLRDRQLTEHLAGIEKIQYYLLADKLLYSDLMGQSLTLSDILTQFKDRYTSLYDKLFQTSKELNNVLS